jgi:hypothetical protein
VPLKVLASLDNVAYKVKNGQTKNLDAEIVNEFFKGKTHTCGCR